MKTFVRAEPLKGGDEDVGLGVRGSDCLFDRRERYGTGGAGGQGAESLPNRDPR